MGKLTQLSISHRHYFRSDVQVTMAGKPQVGAPNGVTTISTIAVQNTRLNTKLIIALLNTGQHHPHSVQLRVMEMEPAFAWLGNTFQEASNLRNSHVEVIQKIQNKQLPVEELLAQADQMVASQESRALVYSAMADSLGAAWRDLNRILEERKILLDLNYTFQEHYQVRIHFRTSFSLTFVCFQSFKNKADDLLTMCFLSERESTSLNDILKKLKQERRSMLELTVSTLKVICSVKFGFFCVRLPICSV